MKVYPSIILSALILLALGVDWLLHRAPIPAPSINTAAKTLCASMAITAM